jgi:hypothetical protein
MIRAFGAHCQYETLVLYHTRTRNRSAAGTPNGANDHPTRTDTCISTTTAAIMRALQPPYKRSQHIGVVIGPDALSGIGRQERPISGLGERAEILILARDRGDNGDPLLLGRIFLNVAAVIKARKSRRLHGRHRQRRSAILTCALPGDIAQLDHRK